VERLGWLQGGASGWLLQAVPEAPHTAPSMLGGSLPAWPQCKASSNGRRSSPVQPSRSPISLKLWRRPSRMPCRSATTSALRASSLGGERRGRRKQQVGSVHYGQYLQIKWVQQQGMGPCNGQA
jgi:hypothetical protein